MIPRVKLLCPACRVRHVDRGSWARRPHHTHFCASCGHLWDVKPYAYGAPPLTVGGFVFLVALVILLAWVCAS